MLKLRGTELFYQRLSFVIDVILGGLFIITPNVSILVTFGWFVFIQKETLKPSVAFSAISVLLELRYLLRSVRALLFLDSSPQQLTHPKSRPLSLSFSRLVTFLNWFQQ